jgi:hypothetical protein
VGDRAHRILRVRNVVHLNQPFFQSFPVSNESYFFSMYRKPGFANFLRR